MHQLYKLGRTMIDAAQRAQGASDTGMSPSEFLVVRDLFLNGESSVSEIVSRTDVAQSRVSICIKALVNRGWATIRTDPADGRKTLARVTARVEAEGLRRRTQDAYDALAPLLAPCPPEDRDAIAQALERLYALAVDGGDDALKLKHLTTAQDVDPQKSRLASDKYAASNRPPTPRL